MFLHCNKVSSVVIAGAPQTGKSTLLLRIQKSFIDISALADIKEGRYPVAAQPALADQAAAQQMQVDQVTSEPIVMSPRHEFTRALDKIVHSQIVCLHNSPRCTSNLQMAPGI